MTTRRWTGGKVEPRGGGTHPGPDRAGASDADRPTHVSEKTAIRIQGSMKHRRPNDRCGLELLLLQNMDTVHVKFGREDKGRLRCCYLYAPNSIAGRCPAFH